MKHRERISALFGLMLAVFSLMLLVNGLMSPLPAAAQTPINPALAPGPTNQVPLPALDGPIAPKDYPKVCAKVKEHFISAPWPAEVLNAKLRSPKKLKPAPGKKWLLTVGYFKMLVPAGEYDHKPVEYDSHEGESSAMLRSHNGLSLMIRYRTGESRLTEEARKFAKAFNRPMSFIDFFLEAYSHKPSDLKCGSFSDKNLQTMIALSMKEADLMALSAKLKTLRVYKIDSSENKGLLRAAAALRIGPSGPASSGGEAYRLVMEAQNAQGAITVLATVADQKEFDAMIPNLLGVGDEDSASPRPEWFMRLPAELERGPSQGAPGSK